MKKLPEVKTSFRELYNILIQPIKSKLLLTGIELGVFNQLSEPKSIETIAKAMGTHPRNTRLFLDGLVACDLLEKKNGFYKNTPVSQMVLVEGSPIFLGQFFSNMAQRWFKSIDDLPKLVKEGPPPAQKEDADSEGRWAQSAVFIANHEQAVSAQQAVRIVSNLPEFKSFRKMLDLGGGPGLIGIAIVAAHKSMKGIIFDRPEVVKVARGFIKEYEIEDRMEVMGGDFIHDSIGDGYDLIWASAVLHFCKDNMGQFMKKIYDALNPGGMFISYHCGLTNERTKPDIMVLRMMPTSLTGKDICFDQGFIADSMLKAGFKSVCSRTIDTDWGPMDMDIGRK